MCMEKVGMTRIDKMGATEMVTQFIIKIPPFWLLGTHNYTHVYCLVYESMLFQW